MRGFGLLLVALGIAALVLGNVGVTRRREVARFGTFSASVKEKQDYPAARYAGVALLAAGAVLGFVGHRRRGSLA